MDANIFPESSQRTKLLVPLALLVVFITLNLGEKCTLAVKTSLHINYTQQELVTTMIEACESELCNVGYKH